MIGLGNMANLVKKLIRTDSFSCLKNTQKVEFATIFGPKKSDLGCMPTYLDFSIFFLSEIER